MALVPPTNSPGANLWDQATQGSDHTMQPNQPPMIPGGPEGVIYADAGTVCSNELGVQYTKKTDRTLATGWKAITSA